MSWGMAWAVKATIGRAKPLLSAAGASPRSRPSPASECPSGRGRRACRVALASRRQVRTASCPFWASVTSAPALLQQEGDQPLVVGAVLGQEDAAVEPDGGRRRRRRSLPGRRRLGMVAERTPSSGPGGDGHAESASLPRNAADRDVAAEHVGQPLADRQPQARFRRSGGSSSCRPGRRAGTAAGSAPRSCRCPCRSRRSATWVRRTARASKRTTTRTSPASVNLMALPTRLIRICRRRTGSEMMVSGSGPSQLDVQRQALRVRR